MKWNFYHPRFQYESMYTDLGGPWSGHKYFAYDLVRNLKPALIVELGTHLGCSMFSFAQAAKDARLKTKIDAVDTWQGDGHTGSYDEIILGRVKEIKKALYSRVKITLKQMTFDEALPDYKKGSIDILHIDGFHTYKAVKHDYDTWYDKVKKDGIIMIHDVAVKNRGFGTYLLLEEEAKKHHAFAFTHSYGLGVIFKSAKAYAKFKDIAEIMPVYYDQVAEKHEYRWQLEQKELIIDRFRPIIVYFLQPLYQVFNLSKRIIRKLVRISRSLT